VAEWGVVWRLALVLFVLLGWATPSSGARQAPIGTYDLVDYRLTQPVFDQFSHASRLIGELTSTDTTFTFAPLFTREVALSGDAIEMAAGLMARLENHPGLSEALRTARITPREFTKFALTIVAAHLAHGFLKSGALKRVPSGAPAENVAFVDAHDAEVTRVLATLGIVD
jgi:hypothetical protein